MKRLPRQILHRIYNPIDNRPVNSASYNPEMLENGLNTYSTFKRHPICSAYSYLVDDGIEYNTERLEVPSAIPTIGLDQYENSDLYRLQNPEFSADYAEHNSIHPNRPLLRYMMLKNYLKDPTYNLDVISGNYNFLSAMSAVEIDEYDSTDPIDTFEREYQAFIRMLKAKRL